MLGALTVAMAAAAASVAALVAQAGGGGGEVNAIAPFVQTGGTVTAVGALVYAVRQLVNGNLVAKPVAEVQTEVTAVVHAAFQREDRLAARLADSHAREDAYAALVDRTAQTLGRATAELERRGGQGV